MTRFGFRSWFGLGAIAIAALFVMVEVADARIGGGRSFGSRGVRTFAPPAATQTVPGKAAPIERSMTTPARPAAAAGAPAAVAGGGLFNRPGLIGGLAAGFLGAGLFGLLFGNGLLGGLGGLASVIGLLLQVGLVILVARLAWVWWQRRQQTHAFAGLPRQIANEPEYRRADVSGAGLSAAAASMSGNVSIQPEDYDAFEGVLAQIQEAFSNEDLAGLRRYATPEMVSYFAEDLTANASRGVVNRISDVRLLQGDLAESWREGASEYATVAMRFSLVDKVVRRSDGAVVEGDDEPSQVTEVWTFVRSRGGSWLLAAIQQA
ncbi:MAG TPA: TIM44-like domain-containing protein [Xanthobacteraceae bacterium]|nr:TIM44-like domain-containing protein [Xanthobacteraceae bacterium]